MVIAPSAGKAPKKSTAVIASRKNASGNKKVISSSARAELIFSIPRVNRYVKSRNPSCRIARASVVYMTAVVEYICAEVLELAGNACRDTKKYRIIPRHILLALRNDEELHKLSSNVTIAQGGVLPTTAPGGKTAKGMNGDSQQ